MLEDRLSSKPNLPREYDTTLFEIEPYLDAASHSMVFASTPSTPDVMDFSADTLMAGRYGFRPAGSAHSETDYHFVYLVDEWDEWRQHVDGTHLARCIIVPDREEMRLVVYLLTDSVQGYPVGTLVESIGIDVGFFVAESERLAAEGKRVVFPLVRLDESVYDDGDQWRVRISEFEYDFNIGWEYPSDGVFLASERDLVVKDDSVGASDFDSLVMAMYGEQNVRNLPYRTFFPVQLHVDGTNVTAIAFDDILLGSFTSRSAGQVLPVVASLLESHSSVHAQASLTRERSSGQYVYKARVYVPKAT